MTMHIDHGDTHENGLCDECPRCKEHAERPTGLDQENMRRIWSGRFVTQLDVEAYNVLYRSVVVWQRLTEAFQWEGFDEHKQNASGFADAIKSFNPLPREEIDLFKVGGRS